MATAATTRVLIDFSDGLDTWSTVGASANIIEASWQALSDGLEYALTGLNRTGGAVVQSEQPALAERAT